MSEGLQALSDREKETLRLLLGGPDAKSIARSLGLSVHTVNERLRDARRKLGVASSREAARRLAKAEADDPNLFVDKRLGVAGTKVGWREDGHSDQRQ
jgi:DNA-binding CsgD family transcriptional regulator